MHPMYENAPANEQERVEDREMEADVLKAVSGPAWKVDRRLAELDREWSLERVLGVLLSLLVVAGVGLGAVFGPVWLWLAGVAGAMLFLNTAAGLRPGRALCHAVGLRCKQEIERERYVLKALRGDFQILAGIVTPHDREALARFEGEGGAVSYWTAPDASDPNVIREAMHAVER